MKRDIKKISRCNKRNRSLAYALFLIINLIFSIVAFSGLINAPDPFSGGTTPSTPGTPPGGGTPGGGTGGINPGLGGTPGTTPVTTPGGTAPPVGAIPIPTPGTGIPGTTPGIPPGGTTPPTTPPEPEPPEEPGGPGIGDWFKGINLQSIIQKGAIGAGIFGTIGSLAGGDDGALWGALAGGVGGAVAGLLESHIGEIPSILVGIGVATMIFLLTYKKTTEEIVEFYCLPWQAPIGGQDCQLCNDFKHCSEYMCKSLGQACEIINQGTEEQKCIWKNPQDVNSPIIKMTEVSKEHKFIPDKTRPDGTGVVVSRNDGSCIKAFFPLEFKFVTRDKGTGVGEPSQCKIDYNLTKGFEEMKFFVGGDNLFKYNHTEKLSLPGPDAINAVAPELKNNGDYNLFIRCQDANGNFNQDAYSVSFCVEKGPDTTPPLIVNTNVPSGNPVQFNQTNLNLEVYVNEPSECKWSREDRDYDNMENQMKCSTNLWEMNAQQVYTCKTKLTGIQDRKDNNYYFKCKDQPWKEKGDRNENKQSYLYKIIGTQPLNILEIIPNGTVKGATDSIPVFLEIKTDNGYKNGESLCYYYNDKENSPPIKEEDYVLFHETKSNKHKQRQDLLQGNYVYFFKCVDLGGNAVYSSVRFNVEVDRKAPEVIRVYRENELKIITDESSECSYSNTNCNFEIESGIKMDSFNFEVHTAEWILNKNYYIRCKDKYDNQPNPNVCSIIVRPSQLVQETEKKSDKWDFSF